MKRKIGIILFALFFSFILQACAKDKFMSDTHKRDDLISRQFDMICCEKDYGTVCVETTDEAAAREVVKNIDNALKNIELQPAENEKQTIYVLNSVPSLSLSVVGENIIFADYEKVRSGDASYIVQELLYRYYDCDYWISYGLAHRNDDVDLEELKQYYSNSDNRIQLQLYGNHFFETFQDARQCNMVKNTAVSLMQNICASKKRITKDIVNEIENDKEEAINSWLEALGLAGDFKANSELTENHLTFYSFDDELFYIALENIVIRIEGSPYNPACVRDISEIDDFFSYTQQDILDLNTFVENNVMLGDLIDCSKRRICHKYEGSGAVNHNNERTQTIELITWDSFMHEVAQLYLSAFEQYDYMGIEEGLSEYLGSVKFNGCRKRLACEYYLSGWDHFEKERNAYEKIKPIDENSFDMELFYHLWAKSFYDGEKDRHESGQNLGDVYAYGGVGRIEEFADMTYMECEDYVAYIVNNYGLNEVLSFLLTDVTNREKSDELILQYLEEWRATLTD